MTRGSIANLTPGSPNIANHGKQTALNQPKCFELNPVLVGFVLVFNALQQYYVAAVVMSTLALGATVWQVLVSGVNSGAQFYLLTSAFSRFRYSMLNF